MTIPEPSTAYISLPPPPPNDTEKASPCVTAAHEQRIERSPGNAIALLVLALGATVVEDYASRRLSRENTTSRQAPGIIYYTDASKIISGHIDGDDLLHGQMFLLAGMYKTQIGRLAEGASWFSKAGRVFQHLLQRRSLCKQLRRETSHNRRSRDDQILLAAWCCLRLENGVPTELRLPTSGLQHLSESLPLPTSPLIVTGIANEADGLACAALCELQRIQGQVEGLYKGSSLSRGPAEVITIVKQHESHLQRWRENLPIILGWNDHKDGPATSAALANLRHSYWKVKLDILRPFLDYVLHILPAVRDGMELQTCLRDANGNQRSTPERYIAAAIDMLAKESGEREVLRHAELCTYALKQKLAAFDGICALTFRGCMVSVVHDQFRDLLVLTAIHRSGVLSCLVSLSFLQPAYEQMIDSLDWLANLSSTCAEDSKILKRIQRTLVDPSLAASGT